MAYDFENMSNEELEKFLYNYKTQQVQMENRRRLEEDPDSPYNPKNRQMVYYEPRTANNNILGKTVTSIDANGNPVVERSNVAVGKGNEPVYYESRGSNNNVLRKTVMGRNDVGNEVKEIYDVAVGENPSKKNYFTEALLGFGGQKIPQYLSSKKISGEDETLQEELKALNNKYFGGRMYGQ